MPIHKIAYCLVGILAFVVISTFYTRFYIHKFSGQFYNAGFLDSAYIIRHRKRAKVPYLMQKTGIILLDRRQNKGYSILDKNPL